MSIEDTLKRPWFISGDLAYEHPVQVGDASVGSLSWLQDETAQSRKQCEWGLSHPCTLAEVASVHLCPLMIVLWCAIFVFSMCSIRFISYVVYYRYPRMN